jgi:hypothetical protein
MKSIFISLVSLSLLISSHTAMASDPHGKHGKSGDLQAPATMSEIFSEVDKRLATLDRTVEKGDLHRVHQIAFETRDLLLAIPGKATLSDKNKGNLAKSLKKIGQQAALLDKYGDAGNARMTKVVLKKFKSEIALIKNHITTGTNQN